MSFLAATAVTHLDGSRWSGEVQPGWDITGVTNGGYLMAMAGRVLTNLATERELVSLSVHFTRPAAPGPVLIEAEPVKMGKGFSTFRAEMQSDGKTLLSALGTLGQSERNPGPAQLALGGPPSLPAPEECVKAVPSSNGPFPPPFVGQVDVRVHPEDAPTFEFKPTGSPRFRGWFRLLDGEPLDALAVIQAADAFPPAIFNAGLALGWTPTLEMTTHIRGRPAQGWLACSFQTRYVGDGLLEEDGEIWDEGGRMVGLSRQLALVPRPLG